MTFGLDNIAENREFSSGTEMQGTSQDSKIHLICREKEQTCKVIQRKNEMGGFASSGKV